MFRCHVGKEIPAVLFGFTNSLLSDRIVTDIHKIVSDMLFLYFQRTAIAFPEKGAGQLVVSIV